MKKRRDTREERRWLGERVDCMVGKEKGVVGEMRGWLKGGKEG